MKLVNICERETDDGQKNTKSRKDKREKSHGYPSSFMLSHPQSSGFLYIILILLNLFTQLKSQIVYSIGQMFLKKTASVALLFINSRSCSVCVRVIQCFEVLGPSPFTLKRRIQNNCHLLHTSRTQAKSDCMYAIFHPCSSRGQVIHQGQCYYLGFAALCWPSRNQLLFKQEKLRG